MKPPEYRKAACCLTCRFYSYYNRCLKHSVRTDINYVCSDFEAPIVFGEVEKEGDVEWLN